ncbi:MAG: hypothetical protein AAGK77_08165 [Pseudomonadota bacterium]
MTKHLSFWLGVFAAALLTVPIAASIMGAAEQELRRIAVTVFVVVAALVVVLVIALFFRDWILRRLFGRAEATLDEVSASLIAGVSAATAGDRAAATQHAQDVVQRGMGWYAWTGFYRWVIATAVALLLAFGAFMGTVLLFEQNRKLGEQTEVLRVQSERLAEQTGFMAAQTELMQAQTERLREQTEAAAMQNEIMSLNLVNEIREQLLASVETRPLGEWLATLGVEGATDPLVRYVTEGRSCSLYFSQTYPLHSAPSAATIGAVSGLAMSDALGDRVVDALRLLVDDTHGAVALGALLALHQVGEPIETSVVLSDMFLVDGVRFTSSAYSLTFRRSYVFDLRCPDCGVHLSASVFAFNGPVRPSGGLSLLLNSPREGLVNGVHVLARDDFDGERYSRPPVKLDTGPYFPASWSAWLTRHKDLPACELLADIARVNPLLTPQPPVLP